MTEDMRIEAMKEDANTIREQYPDIAHRMDKFVALVLERDAGANADLKSENNDLKLQLEAAQTAATDAAADAEAAALAKE